MGTRLDLLVSPTRACMVTGPDNLPWCAQAIFARRKSDIPFCENDSDLGTFYVAMPNYVTGMCTTGRHYLHFKQMLE